MNGLLLTIIITLFICRVNATEQNRIVVMTPNVQDETVQSLSDRFYDARDAYARGRTENRPTLLQVQKILSSPFKSSLKRIHQHPPGYI